MKRLVTDVRRLESIVSGPVLDVRLECGHELRISARDFQWQRAFERRSLTVECTACAVVPPPPPPTWQIETFAGCFGGVLPQ